VKPPIGFGPEFLAWLRDATERAWAVAIERTLDEQQALGVGGASWRRGTRWTADLDDAAISQIERREGLRFTDQHRLFLRALHATRPRMRRFTFSDPHDGERLVESEAPGFYHWIDDAAAIARARADVVSGLLFDVEENGLWPAGWGARPRTAEARAVRVAALVGNAPPLAPIYGHRFVVDAGWGRAVVLSIVQSDVVVYGSDLRSYLLNELHDLLGTAAGGDEPPVDATAIPFWGELLG
jgi:hypothetical protein